MWWLLIAFAVMCASCASLAIEEEDAGDRAVCALGAVVLFFLTWGLLEMLTK